MFSEQTPIVDTVPPEDEKENSLTESRTPPEQPVH
ncbi:hypothetical protein TNCV_4345721, partial [Trichonephila clavipes]